MPDHSDSRSAAARPAADEALALTVHRPGLPDPAAARTAAGRWRMLAVLAVCAAPVLASYFMFYVVRPAGAAYGQLIQPTRSMPDAQARGVDGTALALRSLHGQWLMVVVDGGACAAACEQHLYLQRQLREMMGRERDRIDKVWLVTDDAPIRPELRAALAATPAMHILRLPRSVVEAWFAPAAGRALADHLYIVDPMGEWMMRAPADADPARLRRDIDRLLRASAGWDQPGR